MLRRSMMTALLLLVGCTAAFAGPFYVGASVGKENLKSGDLGASFDASATAYKAFAGYRFLKLFGIEGGYVDFGSPNDTTAGIDLKIDSTAWDLFAVGVLPLGEHVELFGKAGYFRWDRNARLSGVVTGSSSATGHDPVYGVGAAFKLGRLLAIRLEYERFDMTDTEHLDLSSVGADFRF